MKPNNNFNLTHSLLQTVREVVAQEATMTGKKAMPKKKEPTVMISHGKGGGVKVIPKSQYNPKIHDLADEKEPMAAPVAKVDAKKMDRRKVIAKTIEKKKNGIKLSGKAEFVDVRPKMNETIDGPAEVEQVDEISRGLASRYIDKTKDSSSRKAGRALALKKKWGDKNYGTSEPRVKATEEVSEGYGNDLSRGLSTSSHIKKNTGHKVHFNTKGQMIHTDSNKVITHNADNHSVPELIQHAKTLRKKSNRLTRFQRLHLVRM